MQTELELIIIIVLSIIIAKYFTDISVEHNDIVLNIFNEDIYKLIVLLLIIYISVYSIPIGILCIIAFTILMLTIPKLMENFRNTNTYLTGNSLNNFYGPPLHKCSNYPVENTKQYGNAFYPINTDAYQNF